MDKMVVDQEKQKRIQERLKRARAIRAKVRAQNLNLTQEEAECIAVEVGREIIESILAKKAEDETRSEVHARPA